jgi:hypothetical protein
MPLSTVYFSYFVAGKFNGGGNQRKPLTCRKSLTNFKPLAEFELTTLVVIDSDCIVSYKSNYHTTLGGIVDHDGFTVLNFLLIRIVVVHNFLNLN